jgi:predicted small lipoprotein YifL
MNPNTPRRLALIAATLLTIVAVGCGQKGPLVKPAARQAKPASAPVDPTSISTPGVSIPSASSPSPQSTEQLQTPVK